MINKTVRIHQAELIAFFYPHFKLFRDKNYNNPEMQLKNLYFHKTPLIYKGKNISLIDKMIKDPEMKIIIAAGPKAVDFDIDLLERKNLLTFVFNKWNKVYKQKTKNKKEQLENMADDEFLSFIKTYWVTGEEKPFNLMNKKQQKDIELLTEHIEKNQKESFRILFLLLEQGINPYHIEKKLLDFIESQSSLIDEDKKLVLSRYSNSREFFKEFNHRLNVIFLLSLLI